MSMTAGARPTDDIDLSIVTTIGQAGCNASHMTLQGCRAPLIGKRVTAPPSPEMPRNFDLVTQGCTQKSGALLRRTYGPIDSFVAGAK